MPSPRPQRRPRNSPIRSPPAGYCARPIRPARAERNSSTAAATWSHSACPTGSYRIIIPRRAIHTPWASMSKKNSSFSA